MTHLHVSLCAVLITEACNIGVEPLVRPDVPALTYGRLLVDAQTTIPLAHEWGGGEVASADGLRFVVQVRTLNAGPNCKYYNAERSITYYNFTSDQFTGFHGIVIPGTVRDSMFILEGLLEQQMSLRPMEVMADTAGVSLRTDKLLVGTPRYCPNRPLPGAWALAGCITCVFLSVPSCECARSSPTRSTTAAAGSDTPMLGSPGCDGIAASYTDPGGY